jgi:heat shock protein HtpX
MYKQIAANKRKTFLLMVVFVLFVGLLGWLFGLYWGDPSITRYVLIGALVYVIFSYYSSSKLSLAVNGAKQIAKRDNPRLYRIVENLSITDGMPMPKVYIIEEAGLNAFATGRNPKTASVAVTTGLLEALDDKELQGVMAHELGHVKNYDIRVSMVAFAMVAVVGLISDIILRSVWFRDDSDNNSSVMVIGIVAAVLAPLIAMFIQLSISRKREYLADATGVLTTRYPEGLIGALEKIQHGHSTMKRQNSSTAHLFFANPLKKSFISGLFSTHPPISDRIARLREMGGQA